MTQKEWKKLSNWNFHKNLVKGYLEVFPEQAATYISPLSEYDKNRISEGRCITVYPDDNGFRINENSISCKTICVPSVRVNIPYQNIQKVRLYNFNY